MSENSCLWHWNDAREVVMVCSVHGERQVIKPAEKAQAVEVLRAAGEWDGPTEATRESTEPAPKQLVERPVPITPTVEPAREVVEYAAMSGVKVNLTIQAFQSLLCRDANSQQAQFMMSWCLHNRIDPYAQEAHFSIMDGKPVIQVSKDAWFKRMEAHPDFVDQDSGILVRIGREALRVAALIEHEDYVINAALKRTLLDDSPEETIVLPEKLTVKKRGQFCDEGEELVGGWASITKKSRPLPILFQIPLKGWELKKSSGEANIFWATKASFMIWKSALKNAVRLAFPDLSGLLGVPEFSEEEGENESGSWIDPHSAPTKEEQRVSRMRELHAVGNEVPPAMGGPFNHLDLHHIAVVLYEVESLSHLTVEELSELIGNVKTAQTDKDVAADLVKMIESQGERSRGSLKLPRVRSSDANRHGA